MHELSVALDLVEIASEELTRLGAARVSAVHLRAGPLAGIDANALRFSFGEATAGTPLDGARLDIEVQPLIVWCDTCDAERDVISIASRRCRTCHAVAPRVVRGDAIELVGLEIVEA
jgi:hydrogenase nickel incorporation protein HypA/HybF